MISFLVRAMRSLRFRATRAFVSPSERHLRQISGPGFQIVLFLNEHVGRWIWANGVFEKEETQYFQQQIRPDDICLDVGGNVGYMALLFASIAKNGKVFSFEPIALNAAVICTNAQLNDMPHLEVVNAAVGAADGYVTFSVSTDSAYSSINATGRMAESRSIEVPVTTLDAFVSERGLPKVDILKVDVEGAEAMVIDGGEQLLRDRLRRPRIILLELFSKNLSGFGTSVKECLMRMEELGYDAFFIPPAKTEPVPFKQSAIDKYSNIIFLPRT